MIGHVAIAIALLGINDPGRSVTPAFLFRNRFHLQLFPHCPTLNKNQKPDLKTPFTGVKYVENITWRSQDKNYIFEG